MNMNEWISPLCICTGGITTGSFLFSCFKLKLFQHTTTLKPYVMHQQISHVYCPIQSYHVFKGRWNSCTREKYHFNTPCWWICTQTSCFQCNQRCCKALIQSALSPSEGWRTTLRLWLNGHPHRRQKNKNRQTGRKQIKASLYSKEMYLSLHSETVCCTFCAPHMEVKV